MKVCAKRWCDRLLARVALQITQNQLPRSAVDAHQTQVLSAERRDCPYQVIWIGICAKSAVEDRLEERRQWRGRIRTGEIIVCTLGMVPPRSSLERGIEPRSSALAGILQTAK